MRIGLSSTVTNTGTIDDLVDEVADAARRGLAAVWVPNHFGMDALTALAVVGHAVPDIGLGTAVVPIYTRHPFAMAQQALTVQAAAGGRFTLGIGLSHRRIVEGAWGIDFSHPASDMRRYLEDLTALVRGATAEPTTAVAVPDVPTPPRVPGAAALPVVVAALGPRMLDLAGALADGVVLWCVGPTSLATSSVPRLTEAARRAGRPAPRVVTSVPVCVTDDADGARARIAQRFGAVEALPSYRRALDGEGVGGVADVALVGSAAEVGVGLQRFAAAGATEFNAMVVARRDEREATLDVLAAAGAELGA